MTENLPMKNADRDIERDTSTTKLVEDLKSVDMVIDQGGFVYLFPALNNFNSFGMYSQNSYALQIFSSLDSMLISTAVVLGLGNHYMYRNI